MDFFEFSLDTNIKFVSIHKIGHPGWKPRLKLLQDYDIAIVKKKVATIYINSNKIVLRENQAYISGPGETILITDMNLESCEIYVIHFTAKDVSGDTDDKSSIIKLPKEINIKNSAFYDSIFSMFEEKKYNYFFYETKLNILTYDLLIQLYRFYLEEKFSTDIGLNYGVINKHFKKIIDFLHANYMHDISSKEVEEELHLNYDYLNSLFKKISGFTIMNYLDSIRITRAKELLESTDLKISNIASLVGIPDPHYFSKKYRKKEGIPPSKVRKSL